MINKQIQAIEIPEEEDETRKYHRMKEHKLSIFLIVMTEARLGGRQNDGPQNCSPCNSQDL